MSFFTARLAALVVFVSLVMSACGGGNGDPAPAPTGVTATAGNNQVTITWTEVPGVEYWIVYAAGSTISTDNPPGIHYWALNVHSPAVIAGLTNGTAYAFAINGRTGGGKGGPSSASVTATPRLAAAVPSVALPTNSTPTWVAGTGSGGADLRSVWQGTTASSVTTYLAGGDALLTSPVSTTSANAWTSSALPTNFVVNGLTYGNSKYVAVGFDTSLNQGAIYTSTDLATWTSVTVPASVISQPLRAVSSVGASMIAVGDTGTIIYSTDGTTWTAAAATSPVTTAHLYGVTNGGGYWIAVGQGGKLLTSTDGVNWTARAAGTTVSDLRGVAVQWTGSVYHFVAVGLGGAVVTSTDGQTWSTLGTALAADLYAVNASSDQILAVGASGSAYVSPDSTTWASTVSTGVTTTLRAIYGSSTGYYVVGDGGTVIVAK